jgi:RNA polymerase sigma-70 factor (ECF subfamily)
MDDAQAAVKGAGQGGLQDFASLVEAYQVPVYNLCARMLWDPADAEDAAQETFLRAYRRLDQYDQRRSFASWLLSIAAHHCIDRLRRRRLSNQVVAGSEVWESAPDSSPGPEAALEARQREQWMARMLRHLDPTERLLIVFRYWYELSYAEIASELSIPVATVKSRLHRAKRKLAQRWLEQSTPNPIRLAWA